MSAVAHLHGSPARVAQHGTGRVVARSVGGKTVLAEARASSPLRFVAPTFGGSAAALCLVSFGGGLVDGDRIDVELVVEAGATLVVFTQSSTKVFVGASSQSLKARVEGTLVFLPDPVAAFADAHYTQRIDVDLAGDGSLVLCDGFTSGRAAYGDRWAMRGLDLRTTITRDGRTLLRDALRLERDITRRLDRFEAFASVVALGPRARPVADAIAAPPIVEHDLVVASSTLEQGAIARIAATSPERTLEALRHRIRNLPEIEAVDPWGGETLMHLSPRDIDKLLLHNAGFLAQKRLARGLRLNYPEAVALLATQLLELVRDGDRSVAELMDVGRRILGTNQVLAGVPALVREVQVEGTFLDGTKLVTVHDPVELPDGDLALALYGSFLPVPDLTVFAPLPAPPVPLGLEISAGEIDLYAGRDRITIPVTSKGDRPIQIGSHYPFFKANRALDFDREAARDKHLDIPAGTAVRFEPGETRTVTLVANGISEAALEGTAVSPASIAKHYERTSGKLPDFDGEA